MLGIKTHQPRRPAQEVGEPLGSHLAHVVGRHFVVPDPHAHRLLHLIKLDMQCQHAGRPQNHLVVFELGLDQRHARQLALGQEFAPLVHHHPGAVKFQSGFSQDDF